MKLIEAMQVKLTVGEQASSWGIEKTNIHAFDKCAQGLGYLLKLNKRLGSTPFLQ